MKKKKWNKQRYGEYYKDVMAPLWTELWNNYLKRIKILRKDIKALGTVPDKEVQLIKTVKYFVRLIDLATNFVDNGISIYAPINKADVVSQFNDTIVAIVARDDNLAQYHNRTEFGRHVTYDTLYLGMCSKIDPAEVTPDMTTRIIDGKVRKVEVELASISDWLNDKVFSVDGYNCHIKQKYLANVDRQLTDILLESIDSVLE